MHTIDLARLRQIPLDLVLEGFNAKRDPADPTRNWKTAVGRISTTEAKFYNHDLERGGGGAIDLVMHLGGLGFKDAVAWLGVRSHERLPVGPRQVARVGASEIATSMPQSKWAVPEKHLAMLPRVIKYLTDTRSLPRRLVDQSIDAGKVWADTFGNAVFSLIDLQGKQIGAELRGTYSKPFHGVRGEKGLFVTGDPRCKVAAFTESAIEALSYQALHPVSLALGTAGGCRDMLIAAAQALQLQGFVIIDAFNNDRVGDRYGRLLNSVVQDAERQRPPYGKDWNNLLKIQA